MPGDPKECRERALRCAKLAAETANPELKEQLLEVAQIWTKLATELDHTKKLLDAWGVEPSPLGPSSLE
jgi:hypothetical protein